MSESNNAKQLVASLDYDLFKLCNSSSISAEGVRELIVERHGLAPNNNHDYVDGYDFFLRACKNKRVTEEIIRYLLEYFPDAASATNEVGWSPLHYAFCNKNVTLNIIQVLIDAAPDSVRSVSKKGFMPLHNLCCNSELDEEIVIQILKFLLEKCPEAVRHANNDGCLPIHYASRWRSPEFCRVLIEAYPGSEKISSRYGALPLHQACANNSLATVEYLFRLHSDAIQHTTTWGLYPIHTAIQGMKHRGNPATAVEIVQFLLDCNPDQKLKQFEGKSLIHFACWQQYINIEAAIQMIKVIFDAHPASVRVVSNNGSMILHDLCDNTHRKVDEVAEAAATQILKFLIEKCPEAVRHADSEGRLPIHFACRWRSPEFCHVLIETYPGSERITATIGTLPLHHACAQNSLATVEYLYRQYPDAINVAVQGHYPIHEAIMGIKQRDDSGTAVEIVQFLLDCDPDQKLIQFRGCSLLQYACKRRYNDSNIKAGIQVIKILFDAHPEAIEHNRIASRIHRRHQQVQAFINGELVYARQAEDHRRMMTPDDNGQLPLHRALQNNVRLGSIKLLVKGNPSALQTFDSNLAIPLHIACQHHDSASVVQYLLSLSATILDAVDRQWNTALHYACRGAKHDTITLLLEKYDAASVSKRNAHGKLPIDLLWESNEVSDRESVEYMGSVFQLVRAYPEMVMKQSVDADETRHGKKRKVGHDDEE